MTDIRPLHPGMRGLLYVAGVFVLIAGLPLYVLSEDTATWFAWTIDPPLTAAFLGACYWAACVLEILSARGRPWAEATRRKRPTTKGCASSRPPLWRGTPW